MQSKSQDILKKPYSIKDFAKHSASQNVSLDDNSEKATENKKDADKLKRLELTRKEPGKRTSSFSRSRVKLEPLRKKKTSYGSRQ